MSNIYINDNGVVVGISEGRCNVTLHDKVIQSIPIEQVEGITILGKAQLTTQLIEYCLTNGIIVSYFSKGGKYFGRLDAAGYVNASRQRMQAKFYDTEFALLFSKRVVMAKLHNQYVVLKRYSNSAGVDCSLEEKYINISRVKSQNAGSVSELMGYEGYGAKIYFQGLGKCVEPDFRFTRRSRRPPMDEFNSMISMGYSILLREIQSIIENHGLNAYFGLMHRDSEKTPSLACDLIEEWRAVIVDSTVLNLINRNIIKKEHFTTENGKAGIYLTKEGNKIFLEQLDKKMKTKIKYLGYLETSVDFSHAIDSQVIQLIKAMENENAKDYNPLWIR